MLFCSFMSSSEKIGFVNYCIKRNAIQQTNGTCNVNVIHAVKYTPMEISEKIQGILTTLPTKPGCYLMKNADGKIIYVGKAINLKNRVRSYFHADSSHDNKTRRLVRDIADIEWIVVGSELEALILEMNLIKKHRPKYNVRLKDDKRYPYIKVHWNKPFPKVTVTLGNGSFQ